jgi:hypothetical protein
MRHPQGLRAAAGNQGFDFLDPANIGLAAEGGFFAGLISHTANGVATHALIVAPRATGASGTGYTLTTNYTWKTSLTATAGTTSTFDGAANTAAMVTAGIANHPAANFCVGLSIDGYSDWYLPARYELDIAYYNLKPTTDNNITTKGINDYSVPKRTVNYTNAMFFVPGDPEQTSIADFQSTGAEPFVDTVHWSSTEHSSTEARYFVFSNGETDVSTKDFSERVRAFRKLAL